jgi:hypothetical protein
MHINTPLAFLPLAFGLDHSLRLEQPTCNDNSPTALRLLSTTFEANTCASALASFQATLHHAQQLHEDYVRKMQHFEKQYDRLCR